MQRSDLAGSHPLQRRGCQHNAETQHFPRPRVAGSRKFPSFGGDEAQGQYLHNGLKQNMPENKSHPKRKVPNELNVGKELPSSYLRFDKKRLWETILKSGGFWDLFKSGSVGEAYHIICGSLPQLTTTAQIASRHESTSSACGRDGQSGTQPWAREEHEFY